MILTDGVVNFKEKSGISEAQFSGEVNLFDAKDDEKVNLSTDKKKEDATSHQDMLFVPSSSIN